MHPHRKVIAGLAVLAVVLAGAPQQVQAFPATPKQNVINYLKSGQGIVSGQHNKEPASQPNQYTQQVKDVTGQYPGLWGGDMMFRADDVNNRQRVIDEAKAQWQAGSLVALTWHACSPTVGRTCEFDGGVKLQITPGQFQEIVTGGTNLNNVWRSRMAEVVPYLRQLKDAGIPVLWRPFHEMNESWNWWGHQAGANGGAKIYQQMRDYFDSQGLDNLIWVWNVQDNPAGGWASYYPGSNYVDVVSLDAWYKSYPSASDYQQIQSIAGSKPIAIAELGKLPTASLLSSQPRWSYFMIWSEQLRGSNTDAEIRSSYALPQVLNRGELSIPGASNPPQGRTGQITGVGSKCVDVAGGSTTNGTAVQLWDCNGSAAQRWTVGTDGTIRAVGKCLDVTGQGAANGTVVQLWDCNGSGAQVWQQSGRQLRNPQSGRVLDVPGGSTTNGTRLQIWDANANPWQQWTLPA